MVYMYYLVHIDMESTMETVTVSPKFQIVIPKSIREGLNLRPGQKIQAILYDGRIELVPVVPARQMRGSMPGIDTEVPRDPDRV
jgi:AbrB family looped-hinge helix DNA binding protein